MPQPSTWRRWSQSRSTPPGADQVVLPVLSVEQMRAADAATLQHVSEATLVQRAGTAVALAAQEMLGHLYGRRVLVLAGKGNNGNDGRVAAGRLSVRGAKVTVLDATDLPPSLPGSDLVIDAVLGTGFRGSYDAPHVPEGTLVLAVDIPSGVNGNTGEAPGRALAAHRTVTFAAWKRGLLLGDGLELSGKVRVADIGVPPGRGDVALVEDADVVDLLPRRPRSAHKWMTALCVVAGSPGMEGAAVLSASAATRSGAGMVRLAVPGSADGLAGPWPIEAVRVPLPLEGWAEAVLGQLDRCRALVVGPGLGRAEGTQAQIRKLVDKTPVPAVVDADALFALSGAGERLRPGDGSLVLTPHEGEYQRLIGTAPGTDRIQAAHRMAEQTGVTALVKGPVTSVAAPSGAVPEMVPAHLLVASGSPRLATAGTGDVLSGVIGAFLARGLAPQLAAALGAHAHGRAAGLGHREGLGAGDLPELVARWLSEI